MIGLCVKGEAVREACSQTKMASRDRPSIGYFSLSCWYQNGDCFHRAFNAKKRGNQDCLFHAIEVRLMFMDVLIFAESRLKKPQYFQGIQSLNRAVNVERHL